MSGDKKPVYGSLPADLRIGFIGGGQMAEALIAGFLDAEMLPKENILISNRTQGRLDYLKHKYDIRTTLSNEEVVKACRMVFLAVKPHIVTGVLKQVAPLVSADNTTFISVAAGVTLQTLSEALLPKTAVPIVRCMPNTPSLVGTGASCFAGNSYASQTDLDIVQTLMSSVGLCCAVPESQVDAMSALFGSSPAFMFMAIEAMADGAVRMGIPRDQAIKFAAQSMMGSAKMVLKTGLHPGTLKDNVCSPGGSTIAGVYELEKAGYRAALMSAIQASTLRARELGKRD